MTITVTEMSRMTAREYAVSLGLAKPARGKMSASAYSAIAKAESQGVTFQKSASELAKEDVARRRASGEVVRRGRKPSATKKAVSVNVVKTEKKKRVLTEEHKAAMQAGRVKAKLEGQGAVLPLEEHEKGGTYSQDWYDRVFQVDAFVCMPDGRTLKVTKRKDASDYTHFVDKEGKTWKAKVNGMWGVRKGWPTGGVSVGNND